MSGTGAVNDSRTGEPVIPAATDERIRETGSSDVRYTVQHVAPVITGQQPRVLHASENAAVEAARGAVGPNVTQVTVEASPQPFEPGTFSVRHFTWKNGQIRDSGWLSWLRHDFVEDRHPSTLGGAS